MENYCAVIVNSARARYLALQEVETPQINGGPDLVELEELENPQATLPDRALFTNLRGVQRSHMGGSSHHYDDHREAHQEEDTVKFSKEVVSRAEAFAKRMGATVLVLAANPTTLGRLRPHLKKSNGSIPLVECPKNLTDMSPKAIHETLATEGLMPARKEPVVTRNGRPR